MKTIIVFPYYSYEEADRYIKIIDFYKEQNYTFDNVEIICANRSFIKPHKELLEKVAELCPVSVFESHSTVNAYPEGPTVFFWEIMDHISSNYDDDEGFVFWHESDMIGIKSDWVSLLESEWRAKTNDPLVMGLFEYGYYLWQSNSFMKSHFNGGACYSKSISNYVSDEYRHGYFDISMYPFLKKSKRYATSKQFAFSSVNNINKLCENKKIAILHGVAQPKDLFIDTTISLMLEQDLKKRNYIALDSKVSPCCQFYFGKGIWGICPIHVNGKFEKLIARVMGYLLFIYISIKHTSRKKKDD